MSQIKLCIYFILVPLLTILGIYILVRWAHIGIDHEYDVVVLGAGGSGLRAAVGLSEAGLKTACISKVFPTQVYISSSRRYFGSFRKHGWGWLEWHMYDAVKGSDWLGDQDAIEYLLKAQEQL